MPHSPMALVRTDTTGVRAPSRFARPAALGESREKRLYREFSQSEPGLPLFSRAWWLDAVAGETGWDVAVVERGGEVVASMPYQLRNRLGFKWLSQPPLTQTLGPWVKPSRAKSAVALAYEKDMMEALIDRLPRFDHFIQSWHHSRTNWLPFYWRGFSQTTRYTYVLPDLSDEDALWANFDRNVRGAIRKASSRFGLSVRRDLGIDAFLALNRMTFARQGKKLPYSEELVRRLDEACARRGCRETFIALDEQGRAHAGEYVVWDENAAYALMGGADPALRNSGATSLCMWEAIRFAAKVTRSYDFEGSMIEPVERQFRAFGGQQKPYFRVMKTNSWLLRWLL